MNRSEIIMEARSWLGTPYRHQGRMKGMGVDCAGVVIGVARELGFCHSDRSGYSRLPGPEFQFEVSRQLVPIPFREVLPADLLTFAFRKEPQHIAIVTGIEPLKILHSHLVAGKCIEQLLDEAWRARIRGSWRFPELA